MIYKKRAAPNRAAPNKIMTKAILACKPQGVTSSQPPYHLMDIQKINVIECFPISASLIKISAMRSLKETEKHSTPDDHDAVDKQVRIRLIGKRF